MNRIARISIGTIMFLSSMIASASTSYQFLAITGESCGQATSIISGCSILINQRDGLGEYAWMTLDIDLGTNSDNAPPRGVSFANFAGPDGGNVCCGNFQFNGQQYLITPVSSQVCSNGQCSTQVTEVTAYIKGTYVDGDQFTGFFSLHFTYVAQYVNGQYVWQRYVSATAPGAITFN
jgi:hypothetical protein